MKFCSVCDNMYYIKTNEEDKTHLIYYCKNCYNEEVKDLEDNNCVYISEYTSNESFSYQDHINKHTHLDPTLSRVANIPCTNDDCPTNHGKKDRETIYIKYDEKNMKFLYLCVECKNSWRNDLPFVRNKT